jgi:hypothetical protein
MWILSFCCGLVGLFPSISVVTVRVGRIRHLDFETAELGVHDNKSLLTRARQQASTLAQPNLEWLCEGKNQGAVVRWSKAEICGEISLFIGYQDSRT